MNLKYIIASTGRSGTVYMARLLTSVGVPCGHESIFTWQGIEKAKKILDGQYIELNEVLVRDVTLPATIKDAIERKLKQEQESLEYEFRLVTASKEAQKQIIEAKGKADANKILSASLTDKILQDKGIEATLELAKSPNSKVVIVGSSKDGLPLILGNN